MTPHINAKENEIAKTVLMPGDPLRAKYIAEKYLKDYKLVNTVRNIYAYTGYYNDKLVTVMASGMGMPSMGIYSYELFTVYNVENIIRIGSCGAYSDKLKLFDIVLVDKAYSDSSFAKVQNGFEGNIIGASAILNNKIIESGKTNNIDLVEGTIYSSDVFYKTEDNYEELRDKYNCLGVVMESFALFHNAKILNKNASCLLSVTDHFITHEKASSEDREKALNDMIEVALKSI